MLLTAPSKHRTHYNFYGEAAFNSLTNFIAGLKSQGNPCEKITILWNRDQEKNRRGTLEFASVMKKRDIPGWKDVLEQVEKMVPPSAEIATQAKDDRTHSSLSTAESDNTHSSHDEDSSIAEAVSLDIVHKDLLDAKVVLKNELKYLDGDLRNVADDIQVSRDIGNSNYNKMMSTMTKMQGQMTQMSNMMTQMLNIVEEKRCFNCSSTCSSNQDQSYADVCQRNVKKRQSLSRSSNSSNNRTQKKKRKNDK